MTLHRTIPVDRTGHTSADGFRAESLAPTQSQSQTVFRRPVLYPDRYCWYVLVCALDLMLTNTVIHYADAIEANALAAHAIEVAGFWGLISLKVGTMIVVLLICEAVGGQQRASGRRLAEWAIAISSIPLVLTLGQVGFLAVVWR